jgi:hypothetical protein
MSLFSMHRSPAAPADLTGMLAALRHPLEYWRSLRMVMFNSYRPERHYMRGHGPKWREKHTTR